MTGSAARAARPGLARSSFAALALFAVSTGTAGAGPVSYDLPEDTAKLRPGPGAEIAEAHCLTCHSPDYIAMQPAKKGHAFWSAEVTKMIKVYGAPIEEADAKAIADYLAATY
ncbi:SorB family sulfite dehydrogenase c-type cytochrome subunit [Methylorubrum extorquens]|uniref:SorB family sulfite dehydrogenase c-type cytochrome subunit n=1 Tax=Methylorubrum extorquens TaxID=408 RepID=UPI001EE5A335|nr:cytochrome c [Methylorubrum extorquens]MCG5249069.1 cytochrome c [Methylorubrum extorquens]